MKITENKTVSNGFEMEFIKHSLEKQIRECDNYELADLFEKTFKQHQPVLEAGCGSGRWCAWLTKKNIKSDGIDWSDNLVKRAQKQMPKSNFFTGDFRNIPKPNSFYGGILALGSIEHSIEGPLPAMIEFSRILSDNGIAIITVPYGGSLRRTIRIFEKIESKIKSSIKYLISKSKHSNISIHYHKKTAGAEAKWFPRFACVNNELEFFEYEFNKSQMRNFISKTNFEIIQEFVAFGDEGILHNFGRFFAVWDEEENRVNFTILGRLLKRIVPVSKMGHMLCYVLKKNGKL